LTAALEEWRSELKSDSKKDFILMGMEHGFNLLVNDEELLGDVGPVECDNSASATCQENRRAVENQIVFEINMGNYEITSKKPRIVSALGCVPKPDSGDVCLIHDASRPYGSSLNDFTRYNKCHYTSVDDVVKLTPPNGYLAKIDLSQAYRCVPIAPSNYMYTGLKWRFTGSHVDTYMFDKRLPFGASPSPEIFQCLTESVIRMLAKKGYHNARVYLDDFIVVGDTKESCRAAFDCLVHLLIN
jgi:hypothetical protein